MKLIVIVLLFSLVFAEKRFVLTPFAEEDALEAFAKMKYGSRICSFRDKWQMHSYCNSL